MPTRYVGIDLAWGRKNTTAAVVLEGVAEREGVGVAFVGAADALTDDDAILEFVARWDAGGGLLVAIDAPTLVPNQTGRRPCEGEVARRYRKYEAGPHPANRNLLAGPDGAVRGEALVAALAARGIAHTPYLDALPDPPRAVFEVFPHPCHVGLFALDRTLKYKAKPNRTRETRLAEFRRYATLLESLHAADPALRLPSAPDFFLRRDPATLKAGDLKRHEDALDALTCAYVAACRHRHGDARTEVIGDLTAGYIVVVSR
jgi:predicted RNase H-like nuclease